MRSLAIVTRLYRPHVRLGGGVDPPSIRPIEAPDHRCVLDHHHDSRREGLKRLLQPRLVAAAERHVVVLAEIAVVGRVDEQEIRRAGVGLLEERREVLAAPSRIPQARQHIRAKEGAHLVRQGLAVVGDSSVRNVELAARVEAEHGRVGELAEEEEVREADFAAGPSESGAVVTGSNRHVEGGANRALDIVQQVNVAQTSAEGRLDLPHAIKLRRKVLGETQREYLVEPRTREHQSLLEGAGSQVGPNG